MLVMYTRHVDKASTRMFIYESGRKRSNNERERDQQIVSIPAANCLLIFTPNSSRCLRENWRYLLNNVSRSFSQRRFDRFDVNRISKEHLSIWSESNPITMRFFYYIFWKRYCKKNNLVQEENIKRVCSPFDLPLVKALHVTKGQ